MFPWIEIAGLRISSYLLLYTLGTLAGFMAFALDYRKRGNLRVLWWLVPSVAIGALTGSKLANIILFYRIPLLPLFLKDPMGVFFRDVGQATFGAFLGALVLVFLGSLLTRTRFLALGDSLSFGALFLGILGRVGCFLNGCCYGRPTSLAWAARFPGSVYPVHPTQLYEAGVVLAYLLVVLTARRCFQRPGSLLFATMIFWGIERFFIEFLRTTPRSFVPWLSWDQWWAVGVALAGGLGAFFLFLTKEASGQALPG